MPQRCSRSIQYDMINHSCRGKKVESLPIRETAASWWRCQYFKQTLQTSSIHQSSDLLSLINSSSTCFSPVYLLQNVLNKLFFSPFSLYLSFPDEVEHACSFILILQCFSPFSLGSLRLFSKFPLLPALLLGNPLYDLLLLTSCHMTSGWLRGKS